MKITRQIAEKIVALIDTYGLCHGAGQSDTTFCVQQAVEKVITNEKEAHSDQPDSCVDIYLIQFGINLNDSYHGDGQSRGQALKRYALAQLGTAKNLNRNDFIKKLLTKLGLQHIQLGSDHDFSPESSDHLISPKRILKYMHDVTKLSTNENIKILADAAADVLKEMGTQGSEFLSVLDHDTHEKRVQEAYKLGNKIWASQMTEMGYKGFCVTGKHA
jgi:hypothetical protein